MTIKRCYPVLVGASVVENQLCNGESVTVPNGHKYYLKTSGTESLEASTGTAITGLTNGTDMVIDLTQMLGSAIADYVYSLEQATAGAGIAKLRSWGFLKGYQAYNAGSIESVEVTEKVCVGFNQWDEEWELGRYSGIDGQKYNSSSNIRCKNYIPVIGGATYYIKGNYSIGCCYDANKNYIGTIPWRYSGVTGQYYLDMPSNASYIRFCTNNSYGTTYNHDICINISSDRNGEYEPYTSTTYSLGSDVLRGIFKLSDGKIYADGDRKEADGTITRKYNLITYDGSSDEDWKAETSSTYTGTNFYIARPADALPYVGTSEYATMFMTPIAKTNINIGNDRLRPTLGWLNFIVGAKLSISTVSDFRTYLASHPIELQYPIVESTEQSTPFTSPQICYPDGTEEFVTENEVPVGHETKYQL